MAKKTLIKKIISLLLIIFSLSILLVGCTNNDSAKQNAWNKQVEKTKNELYYKSSDGKWYPR